MNRILVSLFVLIGAVVVVSGQTFDFPPRLQQHFAIGDENYLIWWGGSALQGARHDRESAPTTARKFAIISTAFFDIVNAFNTPQRFDFFGQAYVAPAGGNVLAAIAGAGYELFNALYPEQALDWQVIYKTQIDLLRRGPLAPTPASVSAGFNFGRDVAADRLREYENDGSDGPNNWVPPAPGDGHWSPVPPTFSIPTGAQYANATTWVIPNAGAFRPEGPAWNDPDTFVNNFREIVNKGRDVSLGSGRRTVLESWTATFFSVEIPGLETLPGLYYDISIEIARDNNLDLIETARLLALTALSLVDASYAVTDSKYFFNDWRPITGIRTLSPAAQTNLEIQADPTWEPFLQTLPCPDYISMTATLGAAAGTVWARIMGADAFNFFVSTDALPGVSATYFSFSQFIDDNAYSRVFAGSSWRKSSDDGIDVGRRIANFVYDNALSEL